MRSPLVALLIGDGVHRDQVRWPEGIDIEHFWPRDSVRLITAAKNGKFAAIVMHTKSVFADIRKRVRDSAPCPVIDWSQSLHQLAKELPSLIGVRLTAVTDKPPERPHVRIVHASKQPERRPSWTDDERAALRAAYEDAVDFQRVVDSFVELTSDIDAPARSRNEVMAELERMRSAPAVPDGGFDIIEFLRLCLGIFFLEASRSALEDLRMVALKHSEGQAMHAAQLAAFLEPPTRPRQKIASGSLL